MHYSSTPPKIRAVSLAHRHKGSAFLALVLVMAIVSSLFSLGSAKVTQAAMNGTSSNKLSVVDGCSETGFLLLMVMLVFLGMGMGILHQILVHLMHLVVLLFMVVLRLFSLLLLQFGILSKLLNERCDRMRFLTHCLPPEKFD